MLVLALDTTTRAGSVALARDDDLVEAWSGDAARTHAARLPGDVLALLARHGVRLAEIDLYAVAAGPGSFTGLRIGIAAIQGFAFANQKPTVGVSALEALAHSLVDGPDAGRELRAGLKPRATTPDAVESEPGRARTLIGAWMDAQRGEVYAQLFDASSLESLEPPMVAAPAVVLDAWNEHIGGEQGAQLEFIGDGALAYRSTVEARLPRVAILSDVPLLAPAIARLARRASEQGLAGPPHAIRPLYVRRPDAELARERARHANPSAPEKTGELHG